jgi:hypothetical protein
MHMRFRTAGRIAWVAALLAPVNMAAAQQVPPLLPTCQQSMITGNWEIVCLNCSVNLVCPITIAFNGAVSSAQCENSDLTTPPSGALTMDTLCHVTGSISYVVGSDETYSVSLSMWLSADGSRISGYGTVANGSPWYELVYRTEGQ